MLFSEGIIKDKLIELLLLIMKVLGCTAGRTGQCIDQFEMLQPYGSAKKHT